MATSFVKVLTAAIMVGALLNLGAQTATAKGGGGGQGVAAMGVAMGVAANTPVVGHMFVALLTSVERTSVAPRALV